MKVEKKEGYGKSFVIVIIAILALGFFLQFSSTGYVVGDKRLQDISLRSLDKDSKFGLESQSRESSESLRLPGDSQSQTSFCKCPFPATGGPGEEDNCGGQSSSICNGKTCKRWVDPNPHDDKDEKALKTINCEWKETCAECKISKGWSGIFGNGCPSGEVNSCGEYSCVLTKPGRNGETVYSDPIPCKPTS